MLKINRFESAASTPCATLSTVNLKGVMAQNLANGSTIGLVKEKDHVPVWRAIVMRLRNPEAIELDFLACQRRTRTRPDRLQMLLSIARTQIRMELGI